MALGTIEIGIRFVRRKPVHALEPLGLVIVQAAGAGTLVTDDPRCLLIKPPVICAAPGIDTLRACDFFSRPPPPASS